MRKNESRWEGFSDSYRTKAHDQISEIKSPRLAPERCAADPSDLPLRYHSNNQFARLWLPDQPLDVSIVVDGSESEPFARSDAEHLQHD